MKTFLYTSNLNFSNKLAQRRVLDCYNIMRYGNKDRGRAIFQTWNIPEGTYISSTGLLIEYAPHAVKKRLEKFDKISGYGIGAGYVYAPYIPVNTYDQMREESLNEKLSKLSGEAGTGEEWFEKDIEKISESRFTKVEVKNNFMGTLLPGETPPETTSYRHDLSEKKKIETPKIEHEGRMGNAARIIRDYYDGL